MKRWIKLYVCIVLTCYSSTHAFRTKKTQIKAALAGNVSEFEAEQHSSSGNIAARQKEVSTSQLAVIISSMILAVVLIVGAIVWYSGMRLEVKNAGENSSEGVGKQQKAKTETVSFALDVKKSLSERESPNSDLTVEAQASDQALGPSSFLVEKDERAFGTCPDQPVAHSMTSGSEDPACMQRNLRTSVDSIRSKRHALQQFRLFTYVLFAMNCTVVIPESYDLLHGLGYGGASSGWIIGAAFVLDSLSSPLMQPLVRKLSHRTHKQIYIFSFCLYAVANLLYAFGAHPASRGLDNGVRFAILLGARALIGLITGILTLLSLMTLRIITRSESMEYMTNQQLAISIGYGLGPIYSCFIAWSLPAADVRFRVFVSSCVFATFWGAVTWWCCMVIPSDFQSLIDSVEEENRSSVTQNPSDHPAIALDHLTDNTRRMVWVKGLLYGTERAFFVSALEAATVLILELEFEWPSSVGGLAVGASFLFTIPMHAAANVLQMRKLMSALGVMTLATCICATASLLFFPQVSALFGGSNAAALILFADALIFSNGYLANGAINGVVVMSSLPQETSVFNAEYFWIATEILQNSIARFVGPPVARHLVVIGGRLEYAKLQFGLSLIGAVTSFSVATRLVHKQSHAKSTLRS